MFKAIDMDGNGTLDFKEFLAWYVASTQEASGGKTDQFLHNVKDKLRRFKLSSDEEPSKDEEPEKEEPKKEEKKAEGKKKKGEDDEEEGEKDGKKEDKKEEKKEEEKKPEAIPAGWNPISNFAEGWSAVAEEPAELCVKDKLVRMRGCVTGKKDGKMFTLPNGCAPAATERFACTRKNGEETKLVAVTVDKDGNVFVGASEGVLCLSSIAFFMK